MATTASGLHLFQGYGIELEYMVVARGGLDILPVTDELLRDIAGRQTNEVAMGPLRWSNELALHVLELKTNGPVRGMAGLGEIFQRGVRDAEARLEPWNGRLLPTAMHPWMDPAAEGRLWPHDNAEIYAAYDRIFGCGTHGWTNLQSVHLNLPFQGDEEFGRLHAAIRLVLPILPGLAASSPIVEGRVTGTRDSRLTFYGKNQASLPSITARVIPEPVFTAADYEARIFRAIAREIQPFDPQGVLESEWLNSRGAIARFERSAIEIRLLDIQEYPAADVAICAAVAGVLESLTEERWCSQEDQRAWDTDRLASIYHAVVRAGEEHVIDETGYLKTFGFPGSRATVGELWGHIVAATLPAAWSAEADIDRPLRLILDAGTLSRRIVAAAGPNPDRDRLHEVYGRLADCLADGTPFLP